MDGACVLLIKFRIKYIKQPIRVVRLASCPLQRPQPRPYTNCLEVIAKHLRDAIVAGDIAEGEPIRQDDVASLFNVSKIPVREALKRLEAEGLVMFQRNKELS